MRTALVLAYLDEEPNLERICIEIAGFRKLLSDGKWSNFLVSPHYGYLANPARQINGRALNSFIRGEERWENWREKWQKSPSLIMKLSPTWIVEKDTVLACGFLTPPGTNWFVNDRILVLIMKCCSIEHLLCRGYSEETREGTAETKIQNLIHQI